MVYTSVSKNGNVMDYSVLLARLRKGSAARPVAADDVPTPKSRSMVVPSEVPMDWRMPSFNIPVLSESDVIAESLAATSDLAVKFAPRAQSYTCATHMNTRIECFAGVYACPTCSRNSVDRSFLDAVPKRGASKSASVKRYK